MSRPPTEPPERRLAEHLHAALDAVELALAVSSSRRLDWRARALEAIAADLRRLADTSEQPPRAELLRTSRRLGKLRPRLRADAALAVGETLVALHCATAALDRATERQGG